MPFEMVFWPGVAAGFLALFVWLFFFANRRAFDWEQPAPAPDRHLNGVTRTTVHIAGHDGELIEGWLYRREGARAPVVILAPGLAGTKEGPLETFAQHFAEQGFAALAIDFRTFGGSEGLPRHNTDPRMQVADYLATVAHVRARMADVVDAERIVLWGTSFSGAAAACAAKQAHPQAVILNAPYIGKPATPPNLLQMAGYVLLLIAEKFGDAMARVLRIRLKPAYITAYGLPGEHAFGGSAQCPSRHTGETGHPFWRALPDTYRGGWRNLMLVRALAHLDAIDPAEAIRTAGQPTLIVAATQDDMIAIRDIRHVCKAAPANVTLAEFDAGHFDVYVAPTLAPNLARQTDFLCTHVGTDQDEASSAPAMMARNALP